MDELEQYHLGEIERFTRSGDWSSMVRHFMRHGGYQPAMDAAIRILEGRAGSPALLGDQCTEVVELLKRWQDPAAWQRLGALLPMMSHPSLQATIILLYSFNHGVLLVQLTRQLEDESIARIMPQLLDSLGVGIENARNVNEVAIAAFMCAVATEGLWAAGRREEALGRAAEAVTAYRELAGTIPAVFLQYLAASLNSLAIRLGELRRREEALQLVEEAVTAYKKLVGQNRARYLPDLAGCLNHMTHRLSDLGRREEALEPAKDAVIAYSELAGQNRTAFLPELASRLNDLARRLSDFGRLEEAFDRSQEAVTAYRELAATNPARFLPALANSLNDLAICLRDLGRREEALRPAQETVTAYRELAEANRVAFLPALANSLNNLAVMLSDLGRREEALDQAQEAVTAYRELAEHGRAEHLPDLALSLNTLANTLSDLGRREEALEPAKDAVKAYRELTGQNRAKHLPDLAQSLYTLAHTLSNLGRREEALDQAQEAVMANRELAGQNRAKFLPELANSLNGLANSLSAVGRREEALALAEEAVKCRRELVDLNRAKFLPDLAIALNNLANTLSDLGHWEEAIKAAQEAVTANRELAGQNRARFVPALAGSLNTLAIMLGELGRLEEALEPAQETVEAYRELAGQNQAKHLPDLARSLNNLGVRLSNLGRREEALKPAQEAVTAYRELAGRFRTTFLPELASSLNNLGFSLNYLGRREEALKPAEEAVIAYRELAGQNRVTHLPGLAMALTTLAMILDRLGRLEEALDQAQEGLTAYRELAGQFRTVFLPELANSLNNLALILRGLGCREEALNRAKEAVTAFRELAGKNPAAFLADLSNALNSMAKILSELGRREEALKLATEAARIYDKLPVASRHANAELGSIAHRTVAILYLTPGEWGSRDLTRALDALRQSIQCVEEHRGSFRDNAHRRRVLAEGIRSFEFLIHTAVDLWDIRRNVEPLQEALHVAEGIRQRQVLDRLRSEVLEPDAPEKLRREWRQWFERLEAAEEALDNFELRASGYFPRGELGAGPSQTADLGGASLSPRPSADVQENARAGLVARREEMEKQHQRILQEVHRFHPGFDPYQPLPRAGFDEARRLLESRPGMVLVEYVVTGTYGYALLVHGGRVYPVRLPMLDTSAVEALATAWREGYPDSSDRDSRRLVAVESWGLHLKERLRELAPEVLWPVLQALREFEGEEGFRAKSLIVCPHQYLNLLPFHAMPVDEGGRDLLVDRYEVSYTPSLSMMRHCARRQPGSGRCLLIGNPTGDLWFMGLATEAYRGLNPEAEVIHGMEATVEAFLHRAREMGRVAVWAHMVAAGDPMASAIGFGGGDTLELDRIYRQLRLKLQPDVELNGCASGLMSPVQRKQTKGRAESTVEVDLTDFDGLPMGFLFAGARSVVSTLWTVFDISAALLMDRYHLEVRKDGETPASALRRASQWLRKEIRNGADLLSAGESLLARVPEQWARAHPRQMEYCRRVLAREAAEHPEDPPFANPIHWASHFVTGWSWDSVE